MTMIIQIKVHLNCSAKTSSLGKASTIENLQKKIEKKFWRWSI
jgi:hypothetical protein